MSAKAVRYGGWVPEISQPTLWQRLWQPFWAVPLAMASAAVAMGLILPVLDALLDPWLPELYEGGPEGARAMLGTITSSMISVTGLVFSVTMVVLQLAGSKFTPRVLSPFLQNRITQVTLGVFSGTFLYSLTVSRTIRNSADGTEAFVPRVATILAFVSVLASVGFFLAFIHHITTSIQVQHVIAKTAVSTKQTLDRMIPEDQENSASRGEPPRWKETPSQRPTPVVAESGADKYLTNVNYRGLVERAAKHDVVITIEPQVGDYVVTGTTVARVWRDADAPEVSDALLADVASCFTFERDRSFRQDIAFGIRQLVDIGERALSPGMNDPTTATETINALHSILRRAVVREVPSGHATDSDGVVRLVYKPHTVEQLLELTFVEIIHWGRMSVTVPARLREVLDDLERTALVDYQATISRLKGMVDEWQESPQLDLAAQKLRTS